MVLFKKLFKVEKVEENNALEVLMDGYCNPKYEEAVKVASRSFKINKTIIENGKYVEFEHGSGRIAKVPYEDVVEALGCEPSFFKRSV